MAKATTLKKPTLTKEAVLRFAEGPGSDSKAAVRAVHGSAARNAPTGFKSGLVPDGDVRLTANIRGDLHLKLKIRAAQERTTVGELIENWIDGWK